MNCTEFRKNSLYLAEGSLNAETKALCLEHRQNCAHCNQLLEELNAGLGYVNIEKQEEPSPWMQERVMHQMKAGRTAEINYVPVIFRLATVLILALATGLLLNKFTANNGTEEKINETSSIAAPATDDVLDNENNILSLNE